MVERSFIIQSQPRSSKRNPDLWKDEVESESNLCSKTTAWLCIIVNNRDMLEYNFRICKKKSDNDKVSYEEVTF